MSLSCVERREQACRLLLLLTSQGLDDWKSLLDAAERVFLAQRSH